MQAESDNTNRAPGSAIDSETLADEMAASSQELQSIDTSVDPNDLMVDLPTDFTDSDYTGDERTPIIEVGDPIVVGDGSDGGGDTGNGQPDDGTGGGNVDTDPDGDYGGGGGDG